MYLWMGAMHKHAVAAGGAVAAAAAAGANACVAAAGSCCCCRCCRCCCCCCCCCCSGCHRCCCCLLHDEELNLLDNSCRNGTKYIARILGGRDLRTSGRELTSKLTVSVRVSEYSTSQRPYTVATIATANTRCLLPLPAQPLPIPLPLPLPIPLPLPLPPTTTTTKGGGLSPLGFSRCRIIAPLVVSRWRHIPTRGSSRLHCGSRQTALVRKKCAVTGYIMMAVFSVRTQLYYQQT